ncbi:MAG: DUF938 domain-containing protein [Steroidobacteraceae bacterium]
MTVLTFAAPERNKAPILAVLQRTLPARGRVLEVASGTGQHIVYFATTLTNLTFLPSDPEQAHRDSIAARVCASGLSNVEAPVDLDVRIRPWAVPSIDAVVSINMIHIAPWYAGLALIEEAARLLPAGGVLVLYGPFSRGGRHTSPSNEAFDASLRERDVSWGVRDLECVVHTAAACSFLLDEVVEMPANNLSVIFRMV